MEPEGNTVANSRKSLDAWEANLEPGTPNMTDTRQKPENPAPPSAPRREVLIKILRVGGLSASAVAAALWLRSRSHRPEEEAHSRSPAASRFRPTPAIRKWW